MFILLNLTRKPKLGLRGKHARAHSSDDQGGGDEEISPEKGYVTISSLSPSSSSSAVQQLPAPSAEELEKATKSGDDLGKEERRRRFLEVKLAREKAQRHLETLVKKKREKEDEVRNALTNISA